MCSKYASCLNLDLDWHCSSYSCASQFMQRQCPVSSVQCPLYYFSMSFMMATRRTPKYSHRRESDGDGGNGDGGVGDLFTKLLSSPWTLVLGPWSYLPLPTTCPAICAETTTGKSFVYAWVTQISMLCFLLPPPPALGGDYNPCWAPFRIIFNRKLMFTRAMGSISNTKQEEKVLGIQENDKS